MSAEAYAVGGQMNLPDNGLGLRYITEWPIAVWKKGTPIEELVNEASHVSF
jgi:hypothetical protein